MSRMGSGLRKSMVLVGVLALVVPLLFALATPVSAATLRVNNGVACDDGTGDPYCTIQAAVDDAGDGDVIQVYPGTYTEGVDLSNMGMGAEGDLTLVTVNNAGNPTPGTVTVHNTGIPAEFYTDSAFDGDLTIDGFIVHSAAPGIDVAVDGGAGANRNVVIRNVTATETEHDGIQVSADGNVTISNCIASDNAYHGINVTGVGGDVVITDCTANDNGPGEVYNYNGIVVYSVDGDATVSNCTAQRNGDDGIFVAEVDGNVNISNSTGTGNGDEGIDVGAVGGNVIITDSTGNENDGNGIEVEGVGNVGDGTAAAHESGEHDIDDDDAHDIARVHQSVNPSANGGEVTIESCTVNDNEDDGISVAYVAGDATISNCTAKRNGDDGIEPNEIAGAVEVSACISQDNEEDGIDLWYLEEADSILVNGNIICGNASDGLEFNFVGIEGRVAVAATNADATGNWWGCAAGPADAACDSVNEISGTVDYTPWIDTITGSASTDPATVGSPTDVTFQFSGGPPAVYLGEGPGDLRGPAPFTVTTDNGTLNGNGATVQEFINAPNGNLEVTLVPAREGMATVTVSGACGLGELEGATAVLGVGAEFVPEPGTVLLLGSGLMGLAGYAGLRLRKR